MSTTKAAAMAAAFVALVGLVGGGAFLLTSGDDPPPPTTTSTTAPPPTDAEIAAAVADGLSKGLAVPLTAAQADCVANAFLDVVGGEAIRELVDEPVPLGAVTVAQRAEIVRGIVACVPPDVAATLLGTKTTDATLAPELPGEGSAAG